MKAHFSPDPYSRDRVPLQADLNRALDPYRDAGGYPAAGSPALGAESAASRTRLMILRAFDLALKYKLLIGCICSVTVAGGFITTFLTTPIYQASTTIQIDAQSPR